MQCSVNTTLHGCEHLTQNVTNLSQPYNIIETYNLEPRNFHIGYPDFAQKSGVHIFWWIPRLLNTLVKALYIATNTVKDNSFIMEFTSYATT